MRNAEKLLFKNILSKKIPEQYATYLQQIQLNMYLCLTSLKNLFNWRNSEAYQSNAHAAISSYKQTQYAHTINTMTYVCLYAMRRAFCILVIAKTKPFMQYSLRGNQWCIIFGRGQLFRPKRPLLVNHRKIKWCVISCCTSCVRSAVHDYTKVKTKPLTAVALMAVRVKVTPLKRKLLGEVL